MKRPITKRAAGSAALQYTIFPKDLAGHLFEVTLRVAAPAPDGQVFVLPAWIPGSYMIREFARNIVRIRAESEAGPVALTKLDKHSWRADPVSGPLTLVYEVYAWDMSVRAAHMDQTHAFFNGTSVFLRVVGQELERHVVDIRAPLDSAARYWRVATSRMEYKGRKGEIMTAGAAAYIDS